MKKILAMIASAMLIFSLNSCGDKPVEVKPGKETEKTKDTTKTDDHAGHGHGHNAAPNGGDLVNINDRVQVEVVHNETTGQVDVYVYGKDFKTPFELTEAPSFNPVILGKRSTFEMKSDKLPSSKFTLTDETFKAHIHTKNIRVIIDGKVFNMPIAHSHH